MSNAEARMASRRLAEGKNAVRVGRQYIRDARMRLVDEARKDVSLETAGFVADVRERILEFAWLDDRASRMDQWERLRDYEDYLDAKDEDLKRLVMAPSPR